MQCLVLPLRVGFRKWILRLMMTRTSNTLFALAYKLLHIDIYEVSGTTWSELTKEFTVYCVRDAFMPGYYNVTSGGVVRVLRG